MVVKHKVDNMHYSLRACDLPRRLALHFVRGFRLQCNFEIKKVATPDRLGGADTIQYHGLYTARYLKMTKRHPIF